MRRHMKRLGSRALLFLLCTLFYCEFLVYYLVLSQCSYPTSSSESTKAMVLADTHLLGSRKGHWFDKLRREWQMHRWECFIRRLVITGSSLLFQGVPDSPDLFQSSARVLSWRPLWRGPLVPSRGIWVLCPKVPAIIFHFNLKLHFFIFRFHSLFPSGKDTRIHVVPGNHDMGFHYALSPYLDKRFKSAFNTKAVQLKVSNWIDTFLSFTGAFFSRLLTKFHLCW